MAGGNAGLPAGMACKEVMVSAPVMVLLFDRTFVSGSFRAAVKKSWPLYVGLASGWILLLALNVDAPRSHAAGLGAGLPAYVWWFTQAKVLLLYLKLSIWPWPFVIHHEMPPLWTVSASLPWLLAGDRGGLCSLSSFFGDASPIGYLGAWYVRHPVSNLGGAHAVRGNGGAADVSAAGGCGRLRNRRWICCAHAARPSRHER